MNNRFWYLNLNFHHYHYRHKYRLCRHLIHSVEVTWSICMISAWKPSKDVQGNAGKTGFYVSFPLKSHKSTYNILWMSLRLLIFVQIKKTYNYIYSYKKVIERINLKVSGKHWTSRLSRQRNRGIRQDVVILNLFYFRILVLR